MACKRQALNIAHGASSGGSQTKRHTDVQAHIDLAGDGENRNSTRASPAGGGGFDLRTELYERGGACLSFGLETDCLRLEISSRAMAHWLEGLRRRAEGGGHFLGWRLR